MKRKFSSLAEVANNGRKTLYRFPFALITAIVGSFAAIWLVEIPWEEKDSYFYLNNLAFVSAFGIAVFLSVTTLAEQLHWNNLKKQLAKSAALLFLILYYFLLPEDFSVDESEAFIRYLLYFLAAHLLVSFAPFLNNKNIEDFWLYNKTLFLRILISLLYTAVLFSGLAIALLSFENLLGFDIDGESYAQLWIVLIGVFNTWFFLAGVPEPNNLSAVGMEYPKALKVFVQYILIPLNTLYIVILYLYTMKILFQWEWPNGWVANLVLTFSVAGIFSLLLLHPIRNTKKNRWIKLFSQGYYIALIPLIVLLALSIWVRISEYGVTVNRFFVAILAIWLSGIVIYFIFSKAKNIKVIPISLFILAVVISFGPQGAFEVSKHSQLNRLHTLLINNEILDKNEKVTTNHHEVPFKDRKQISSTIDYLISLKGIDVIQPYFNTDLKKHFEVDSISETKSHYGNAAAVMELMDVEYVPGWVNKKPV